MNKLRKVLLFLIPTFVLVLLFTTINISAETEEKQNYNIQELDEHQLELLKEKGFTEQLIENYMRSGDTFSDLMEMEVSEQDVKHYRVTSFISKNENHFDIYINGNEPEPIVEEITYEELQEELREQELNDSLIGIMSSDSDYTRTTYKTMTVTLTRINKDRSRVSNFVEWHRGPLHQKVDIIGIGINGNTSPIRGSESGYQDVFEGWIRKDTINYGSNNSNWNRNGDYGLKVQLKKDTRINPVWTYDIYMQYDIRPNVSTLTYYDAYGHYAHQERTFQIVPTFNISKAILSIEPRYIKNFTVHKPQPHAQIRRY